MISDNDPAGTGIAFSNAVNRYTDHRCRLITRSEKYGFDYEKDIHLPDSAETCYDLIRDLLNQADIIHFHMLSDESVHLGPIQVSDYISGKKIVHHHHGHPVFRGNPEMFREKYKNNCRAVMVSTPDLLKLLPEATWIPNPIPINNPLLIPKPVENNGTVIACQAPTRKEIKNTQDFIDVAGQLKEENHSDYMIIEGIQNRKCLEIKNRCHIHFDHMQGYYGVSSLESLSMGKPVIAGIDSWNKKHILEFTGAEKLPWHIARSKEELKTVLSLLYADGNLRRESGEYSRYFMENHWNEKKVIERLIDVYLNR